jgi:predicted membrane-bound dolichyl-phosphate-mannose-protein mannosyltransferase
VSVGRAHHPALLVTGNGLRWSAKVLADSRVGLGVVLVASAVARSFWLATPRSALIFDETYYVNAARVILGWHVAADAPYAHEPSGLDPNHEHPPLGKLLIALSMRIFGDNALGWRTPSLVAGMVAILALYAIVRQATGDAWLGVLASAVFSLDNLVLVHSRIATLDMPLVALMLVGVWLWFRGWRVAAGAALGVAGLVKLGAVYGVAALLLIELGILVHGRVRRRGWDRAVLRGAPLLVTSFVVVWFGGLWLLDLSFSSFSTPWEHLRYMLDYGFSIVREHGPANTESRPWQWLANDVQIPYLRVVENVTANGQVEATRDIIFFRGAMNPIVIGAAPLAVAYSAWRAWRLRDPLSMWVVAWFGATYLSLIPLVLISNRTMYIFYFLATLPAVAVAIAQLLRQSALPRVVTWGYLIALVIGFLDYYPFRRI